jgi:acyl carrier protein
MFHGRLPIGNAKPATSCCLGQIGFGSHLESRGNYGAEHSDMDIITEVAQVLAEVLSLGNRAIAFRRETPLLGAIPELDSMAVVTLITTLEERFGFVVDDDEISADTFATVGTLADFVSSKLAA